ncbi:MAG: hypothetical protein H6729_11790 [Deltaproteobacteria bacterium]|nr:hypothetical protein [Deltaproteobacteria bacterium]
MSWTAVVPVTSSAAFAQSSNEDVRFFHHDAHGAVIAVTDQSGQILERNSPRPFGDVHGAGSGSGSAAASQHSKFLDRPLEPTGLYELGERFYEPRYGRFLSQDPASLLEVDVTNPEGFNRFAYGLNNPYRYNDATGRIPVDTILDAADIAISFHDLWNEPSWTNGLFLAWSIGAVFLPYVPGAWIRHVGKGAKRLDTATEVAETARAADRAADAARGATGKADDVFHVTADGVALPKGTKHKIPDGYVENPHRPGSYGEMVDGKFKERLRIDPATPPGRKGPNHSHYHRDGKGTHYSPAPGDKDPGFQP